MKGLLHFSVWCLILLAAAYDAAFAWQNRHDMASWELNPLARCLLRGGGFECLLAVKFAGLLFAMGVAFHCWRQRHVLQLPLTLFIGCLYLALSVHYLIGSVPTRGSPILIANDAPFTVDHVEQN